jgi:hypothetical protein
MKLFTVLALLFFVVRVYGQEDAKHSEDFRVVFEEIQEGIEQGNVGIFAPHLGTQLQLTLKEGESGYYSANHAYYLLESYFKTRKVVSFEFSSVGEAEATPYATGLAVFYTKGMRESVQVYVALMKSGGRWMIAEINIY